MRNLLQEKVEYVIEKTQFGIWKRFMYETGTSYHEFTSHASFGSLPLLHYTYGRCPETGRRKVAKGIIAVGRIATGVLAIGQAAFGMIALGQLAGGVILGLGQLSAGWFAVGQVALGVSFGLGQLATGYTAIGQFAMGKYVLAQKAIGTYSITPEASDPEAVEHFRVFMELFHR